MPDSLRLEGEIIQTTAGEVAAELQRRGIDPALPVEPDDWLTEVRRFSRPLVEAEGWTDEDIDRMIKEAQHEVEPLINLILTPTPSRSI